MFKTTYQLTRQAYWLLHLVPGQVVRQNNDCLVPGTGQTREGTGQSFCHLVQGLHPRHLHTGYQSLRPTIHHENQKVGTSLGLCLIGHLRKQNRSPGNLKNIQANNYTIIYFSIHCIFNSKKVKYLK